EADDRDQSKLEEKLWDPECPLTDKQIDQFLVVARAVGTFARALDCSSSVRQPSLHMSAAAASRDITLLPWKSLTSIIEYYYMWKTTDRYVQQCRLCVSCWMYWKKYGGLKMPSRAEAPEERTSPSPASNESRSRSHVPRQSNHMVPMRNSGSPKSSMKTKQAFLLQATRLTKLARHMCRDIIRLRRAARRPFVPINCGAIKAECKSSFNSS
ncbi:hypothetical protein GOODEAATRI_005157, partial [Goodea atripinnis]